MVDDNAQGGNLTNVGSLVAVIVTAMMVRAGYFLLGNYNPQTSLLVEIAPIAKLDDVPADTEHISYKLIDDGTPLNEFVEDRCGEYDHRANLKLFFDPVDSTLTKWEQTTANAINETAQAAGASTS